MNNHRQYVKLFLAQIIINWDKQSFRDKLDLLLNKAEVEAIEKLIVHFQVSKAEGIKALIGAAIELQKEENGK